MSSEVAPDESPGSDSELSSDWLGVLGEFFDDDVGDGSSGGAERLSKSAFITPGIAMGGISSIALAGVVAATAEVAGGVLPCCDFGVAGACGSCSFGCSSFLTC